MSRIRWRVVSLVLLLSSLLLALFLSPIFHSQASASLVQLSSDPYTNTTTKHSTEVSDASYSYGSTIVSAFQVGKSYNSGGASNIGWATSTDSGATWTNGFLPNITKVAGGPYQRAGDTGVTYDAAHGTWMIVTNGFYNEAFAILVSLSSDGKNWSNPVAVIAVPKSNTNDFDKSGIACDNTSTSPYYGHCYVNWVNEANHDLIAMSTSTDGGLTWSAPLPTADSADGFNGHPFVQPDGTVVVVINKRIFAPPQTTHILAFTSTDGGASWSSTVTVVAKSQNHPNSGGIRDLHYFTAGMDGAGKLYVVWNDCRYESGCTANDLLMITSTNGTTWSAPQRIPIESVGSGVDHFIPGLGVDASTSGSTAHLGLAYYYYPVANCTSATCQVDVGYVSSTDGGNTWSSPAQLDGPMSVTWFVNTQWGYMPGDYITTSFAGGKAFPVFSVASAPNGSTYDQTTDTVVNGL
ncbi:MAG TPA: sialidase family protein [Ktedonobacteraceae bacterium]|nr:sialidase family protein [Ktedonobacteraceae bacterium]